MENVLMCRAVTAPLLFRMTMVNPCMISAWRSTASQRAAPSHYALQFLPKLIPAALHLHEVPIHYSLKDQLAARNAWCRVLLRTAVTGLSRCLAFKGRSPPIQDAGASGACGYICSLKKLMLGDPSSFQTIFKEPSNNISNTSCFNRPCRLVLEGSKAEFQPSPFFSEQLTAFELWLQHGSKDKQPPEQLPIVLQVSFASHKHC